MITVGRKITERMRVTVRPIRISPDVDGLIDGIS
jgi:hypothetical protein